MQVYEALHYYQIQHYEVLVRLNGVGKNNYQIDNVQDILGLKNIHTFDVNGSNLSKLKLVFQVQMRMTLWPKVFIGDENSVVFFALRKINSKKKFILLDDGVATLNSELCDEFSRFSVFDHGGSQCNKFTHIASIIKEKMTQRRVNLIVGSKFVEVGICSMEDYLASLESMLSHIKCEEVIYIPHRGESKENILLYGRKFGFKVLDNKMPIELFGLEYGCQLNKVISIASTALFTMPLIYEGTKFYSFVINEKKLMKRRSAILNLYKKISAISKVEVIYDNQAV